jgi:hypothetical protein
MNPAIKSEFVPAGKLRVGVNLGNFLLVNTSVRACASQPARAAPTTSTSAAASYLTEFVADIKASGLVARLIGKHGVKGVNVAP